MLAVACGTHSPATIGECAGIPSAADRETCRYELLQPAVAAARVDEDTLDAGLAEIGDVTSRDLVLLRLAIAAPKHAATLCGRVRTAGAEEKCRQVLGRPHLGTERRAPKPAPDGTQP